LSIFYIPSVDNTFPCFLQFLSQTSTSPITGFGRSHSVSY